MTDASTNFFPLASPPTSNRPLIVQDMSAIAEKQDDTNANAPDTAAIVSLRQFFSFADKVDAVLMTVGTLSAMATGVAQPIQIVLLGDIINSFNPTLPLEPAVFRANVNVVARNFAVAGAIVVICGFLQVACWSLTASRQSERLRRAYVHAILTQDLGWFDVTAPMELASRIAESALVIQNGMGRKLSDGINYGALSVSAICIALAKGWELALVLLAFTPVIAVTGVFATKALSTATRAGMDAYGTAGAIAHESLSNVRTVHMFNAIQHFTDMYEDALRLSTKAGIHKGFAVGWGMGVMFFTIFCLYAGGLFYGTLKVLNDRRDACSGDHCYDGGRVITVFFTTLMGAMSLGQAGPCIEALFSARAAAYDVFDVIHRSSLINPLSVSGKKLDNIKGNIEMDRVSFAYPSRPDVQVCTNYSLTIRAGETVALVGPSGSGKSTMVALLERFYDPQSGAVRIDGVDVRELNVQWLRAQIGLVGQEPVLFATSIMENIRYGCPDASDQQVIDAATMANAFDFISEFPLGFATHVGERGAQLSGGQKQRIAIARAIVKKPTILLLDEATSALDTASERIVQQSLDALLASTSVSASRSRTTIIIAHRLSTIRNADKIAVHSNGAIVEMGTHDELMAKTNGAYRLLVEVQDYVSDRVEEEEQVQHHMPIAMKTAVTERSRSARSIDGGVVLKEGVEGAEDADDSTTAVPVSAWRVWQLSMPEWKHLVLGSVGGFIHAIIFPLWGVVVTKMVVLFFEDKPRSELLKSARYWSLAFIVLGVVFGVAVSMQHHGFAVVSQRLIARVRLAAFRSMLRQEIGWYDRKQNEPGALVARLATDAATLQSMTSDMLNQGLVSITAVVLGFAIALYSSWEMTLILLATAPLFLFTSTVDAQLLSGSANTKKDNDSDAAAGSLMAEAIGSIRTVASLGMETQLTAAYAQFLHMSKQADVRVGVLGGVAYGASQGVLFFNVAFLFYFGGKWVSTGRITFEDMFRVIMVIMLTMMTVGTATEAMADQSKVKASARRVFAIIDRSPKIDATASEGRTWDHVAGAIEFQNVAFAYPTRPDVRVYNNFNLSIRAGETVALVGASGSGKSTAIALLEQFYNPTVGSVTLDDVDLRDINLPWMRDRISLVSQEPVLFTGTIAENIGLGKSDGATRREIEDAAMKANALAFIQQFPDGFDTTVGDRGVQVSGGQKQRIAIARAILRDPDVLLLDEATSALDNEGERVVQESLDHLLAQKRRTTVIVAHRLSTIRHADRIVVVENGGIVEQGTHEHLMALGTGGVYRALVVSQLRQ